MSEVTAAALREVAAALEQDGGLLAAALLPQAPVLAPDDPGHGARAAAGARTSSRAARYAALVEAVHEGALLHRGRSRLLDTTDADLALLAGDRLYALGLAWLAELDDVAAVRELADVIAFSAQALAAGAPALEDAAWEAGCAAIAWGGSDELEAAKAAARTGSPGGAEALRAAARQLGGDVAPAR